MTTDKRDGGEVDRLLSEWERADMKAATHAHDNTAYVMRSCATAMRAALDSDRANVERALAESREALEEARGMVIEANNSLYGSQSYFHSLDGGAYDQHHLSRGIEDLKARATKNWRRAERAESRCDALAEALRPFVGATLTHTGQVIGLMREDFDNACAALTDQETT